MRQGRIPVQLGVTPYTTRVTRYDEAMPPQRHQPFIARAYELARSAVAHGNHPFGDP